ncbi:DMT family transporter [Rubinisphaera brasiliensis]|uniref:Guanidinium exporter n=1 Tax=Rubinisphaera brasiliensis (strain ATCC 49424 / DSM 5305 / JCM 21570 / IAM 15109 / NBRC 103401 / IFAM 1448) TaxID=756272 RepID=F0SF77_RUBBR|nr:multidrug efflux SMR transporter [Rubinisphaera brasiliensis]ADY58232.1 small multidrug resistance protein [Rubinisphaera brasiliensis DSM 5305]
MRAWILLVVAGLFETGWAVGLKYTDGFSRLLPTVGVLIALLISMAILAVAVRDLPIGTAYPVWVGIGAIGTVIYGLVFLNEPATLPRMLFVSLLIVSIVGLKMTAGHEEPTVSTIEESSTHVSRETR